MISSLFVVIIFTLRLVFLISLNSLAKVVFNSVLNKANSISNENNFIYFAYDLTEIHSFYLEIKRI